MHFVLKSKRNLYRERKNIEGSLRKHAASFGHKIYGVAVAKDHVHFAILVSNRENYRKFIRAFTGLLARMLGKKLWSLLPYSRIASWGREFRGLQNYLALNRAEAAGEIPFQPRRLRRSPDKLPQKSQNKLRPPLVTPLPLARFGSPHPQRSSESRAC